MSKLYEPIKPDTPVIFSDGTRLFNEIARTYIKHSKGLFILAPSGSGKTYFVENQVKSHWLDGDYLWKITNADPLNDEWESDFNLVQEMNDRSDVITLQAKKVGFWVLGSSNHSLKPDAIVLPPWSVHKKYIESRERSGYDGGARTEDYAEVIKHRDFIKTWKKQGVPKFDSVEKAAAFLSSEINSTKRTTY